MLLTFDESEITHDCDVKIKGMSQNEFLALSLEIGDKLGLEPGWINQAISVFTSQKETPDDFDCLDIGDNLSLFLASPQYLLAMKIMAMRTDQHSHDIKDIYLLLDSLDLKNSAEAMDIVYKYFPKDKIKPQSIAGLKAIFENRKYKNSAN